MRLILALLASLAISFVTAAPVPGEPAVASKTATLAQLRIAAATALPRVIRLSPLPSAEADRIRAGASTHFKRMQIGVTRTLEPSQATGARDLQWLAVPLSLIHI